MHSKLLILFHRRKKVHQLKVYVKGLGVAYLSYGPDTKYLVKVIMRRFGEWSQIEAALKEHMYTN